MVPGTEEIATGRLLLQGTRLAIDGVKMIHADFSLKPHPAGGFPPPIKITGRISRRSNTLSMALQLLGDLQAILIPARAEPPARMNRLWEETCVELFLAPEDSEQYWEFNLSPAGHWNVYRFSGYRQGMLEEAALTSLPFTTEIMGDSLLLRLKFVSDKIITDCSLVAGVSAVIKPRSGEPAFWALTHCGPRPDFHTRDSFLIKLPADPQASRTLRNPTD